MSQEEIKRVGLVIGREWDWPSAFMTAVNKRGNGITAELVKLGGTYMNEACPYAVIVDRISHDIPYYRVYLKYAALTGAHIINNPFTCSIDSKFFSIALINKLGMTSPRTVVLPNKNIDKETTPEVFRNLHYPMDWQAIINYVGEPAILKDVNSGGRHLSYRVHSVDELIQRYDESGTRTTIVQQLIESDVHIHCFVVGQEKVLPLRYSMTDSRYLPDIMSHDEETCQTIVQMALALTRAYGYDVNMVEFVMTSDKLYVINSSNPAPVMDRELMTPEQFDWCVDEIAGLAIERVKRPLPQPIAFDLTPERLLSLQRGTV